MILTTGHIEHREIANYMRLLSVSHVIGLNVVKDFFASITDITGGRVKGYETEISNWIVLNFLHIHYLLNLYILYITFLVSWF